MKRRHPWAALQDYAGNLWCSLGHGPKRWTYRDPPPTPGSLAARLGLGRILTCRCGRTWLETPAGAYMALTHTHLDTARLGGLTPEAWNAYYAVHTYYETHALRHAAKIP
jgi:hypothetical protein